MMLETDQSEVTSLAGRQMDARLTAAPPTEKGLLELARQLDRLGRAADDFLSQQLQQFERAITEFEREKAAWRRQLRRESRELAQEREELQKQRKELLSGSRAKDAIALPDSRTASAIAASVRASQDAPLRILLRPGKATSRQVGLLFFELSKLNCEMGGRGLGLEVLDIRQGAKRGLLRRRAEEGNNEILALKGFSVIPLAARGTHVTLDVDLSDRIENWIAFKLRLLNSKLLDSKLAAEFSKCRAAEHPESWSFVSDATRHGNEYDMPDTGYSSLAMLPNTPFDSIQQQFDRVESCCEALQHGTGLQFHVELLKPE